MTDPLTNGVILLAVLAAVAAFFYVVVTAISKMAKERLGAEANVPNPWVDGAGQPKRQRSVCAYCKAVDDVAEIPDPMRAAAPVDPLNHKLYWSWSLCDYAHVSCADLAASEPDRFREDALDSYDSSIAPAVKMEFERRRGEFSVREVAP